MKGAFPGLSFHVGLEIQRLAQINKDFAVVPEKKHRLSDNARIVLVAEEDILETGVLLLRTSLKKHELGNEEDRTFNFLLRFQKELQEIFFGVNEAPQESFRVDKKNEGSHAFLDGVLVKAGLIRAG
jgi:hypothetical protein